MKHFGPEDWFIGKHRGQSTRHDGPWKRAALSNFRTNLVYLLGLLPDIGETPRMTKKDKRHFKRFSVEGLGIHCRKMSGLEARLIELTAEGALLAFREKPVVEGDCTLRLEREGVCITLACAAGKTGGAHGDAPFTLHVRFPRSLKGGDSGFLDFINANAGADVAPARLFGPSDSLYSSGHYHINVISFGGMQMVSDEPMERGNTLEMDIVFPMGRPPIKVLGKIASCAKVPGRVPARYHIGMEFLEMERDDIFRLKDFIYFVQDL